MSIFYKVSKYHNKGVSLYKFLIVSRNLGLTTGFFRLKGLKLPLKRAQMAH